MPTESSSRPDSHLQRIQNVIQTAQRKFQGLNSCGSPPFWDDFLFFDAEFDELLIEAGRLRCLEHFDLCESLEDLLGTIHERWEEVLKIRCCQGLLNQPPVSRRNQFSDIARIGGAIFTDLLAHTDQTTLRCAFREPPASAMGKSAWCALVETLPAEVRASYQERPSAEAEASDGKAARAAVMEHLAIELSSMERPIRFPSGWTGNSCLDLRFECEGRWALNDRVVAHLLAWPQTRDIADAMRGLSLRNREIRFFAISCG